jgi:hypothetical protein
MNGHTRSRNAVPTRGLAIVAAVVLIGLTAVAFVALASLVRHDVRRTAQTRGEAQLRQLLLAGERAAAASLATPGQGMQSVPLPAALSAEGASLSFTPGDPADETRTVDVDAAYAGFRASQRLKYQRQNGKWLLVRADLLQALGSSTSTTAGR